MDVNDLSARVSARCGIRVEPNDPAFLLVALNQIILEETMELIATQFETRISAFADEMVQVEERVGQSFADHALAAGREVRHAVQNDLKQAAWKAEELVLRVNRLNTRPTMLRWAALGLLGAGLLFVAGLCCGWYVPLT